MKSKILICKRLATKIALITYIGCGVLGFFHVLQMSMMSMSADDCPYSHILQAVGSDSISSHLQILNLPIVTVLSLLNIGLFFAGLLFVITIYNTSTPQIRIPNIYRRRNRLRYSLHISLFSNGILNPKTF